MAGNVRVVGVKRKQIDAEKLALAFLLLARSLQERKQEVTDKSDDEHSREKAA